MRGGGPERFWTCLSLVVTAMLIVLVDAVIIVGLFSAISEITK